MLLTLIAWLAVGLVVGLIANKLVDLRGDDPRFALGVTAAGAVVAGILYLVLGADTARGWDRWGLLSATVGAAAGAALWHGVRSRYVDRGHQSSRHSY